MGFINKATSLFAIFLILATSVISLDVSHSTFPSSTDNHSYLSSGNTTEFVIPGISVTNLVSSFSLLTFGSDHHWQFFYHPMVFELTQTNKLVSYLKYSQKIIPGLPIWELIFPFHIYI